MRISSLTLTALAVLGLTTGVAQAYTVTHSTLGVLFSDDMEGAFSAEIGSWGTTDDGLSLLALTSMNIGATAGGPSGAAAGDDYLQLSRDLTKARWQEAIFTQAVNSGTLDIEFRYWIDNAWPTIVALDNSVGSVPNLGDNLASVTWAGSTGPGGGSTTEWYDYDNAFYNGAAINRGQWNLFQMHVDLDADNYQISVNGVPGDVVDTFPTTVSRVGMEFQDTSKTFFLDSVLEPPPKPNRTWAINASGDWNGDANWLGGPAPNANDVGAIFGSAITSPETVFTNSAVTVESIQFGALDDSEATQSYAIPGQGSINLDSNASTPSIDVIDGTHQFQAVVNLLGPTNVSVAASSSLALNNTLNLNGNTLTKTGAGTLSINSQLSGAVGSVAATAGVVNGSGTIGGDLTNSGATVAPGNSPGKLTVAGDYLQTDGSLEIEINGTSADDVSGNRQFDLLSVGGSLTLSGGSLDIVMGFTPTLGDTFDILDFASINLAGATLNLGLPGANMLWDSSQLAFDGSLTVITGLLGDFDADNDVDGDDFLVWQRGFGTTYTATDLADWQGNYGSVGAVTAAATDSAAAVPEPTSASLLIVSLSALILVSRHWK